jgi:tetratricopeptide (TPR) repeat protein
MPFLPRSVLHSTAALAILMPAVHAADPAVIEQLLKEDRHHAAWRLLQREPLPAGQARTDRLFGLTAVGAGYPQAGAAALERYLQSEPEDATAWLELARARYILGRTAAAGQAYRRLLDLNPGPEARDEARRFANLADDPPAPAQTPPASPSAPAAREPDHREAPALRDRRSGMALSTRMLDAPPSEELDSSHLKPRDPRTLEEAQPGFDAAPPQDAILGPASPAYDAPPASGPRPAADDIPDSRRGSSTFQLGF